MSINVTTLPKCTEHGCRSSWPHAHGVRPEYPNVVALGTTSREIEALWTRGFVVFAGH